MRDELKRLETWEVPDQWREIEWRTPRGLPFEPPRGRSRSIARLVALVVAVVGLGMGFLGLSTLESEPDTQDPSEVEHLVPSERTIDTGRPFPEGAVAGYGSVWVATRYADREGGDLVRLDPQTGDEIGRIAMPSLPGWTFGGAGITTGLGSVWVAASGDIFRVDPSSGSIAETIHVATPSSADLWVDGTGIWVLTFPPHDQESMILYRLDPTTLEVADSTAIPAYWSQNVFAAGGWIYVLASTRGDAPPETLFRIDPRSADIVDRSAPTRGDLFQIVASADRIWFFDDGLRALDAATSKEVVGPIEVSSPDSCCSALVADGSGGVWVRDGGATDQGGAALLHLNREGIVIGSTGPSLDRDAYGIAATYDPDSESLWIVHYKDTVLRIGLAG